MTEKEWLNAFGNKLNYFLKKYDVSQKELADKLNVSEATISKYVNGVMFPSIKMVVNISHILGVQIHDLVYFESRID